MYLGIDAAKQRRKRAPMTNMRLVKITCAGQSLITIKPTDWRLLSAAP